MIFRDRFDAGQHLARRLTVYADQPDTIVLALPRGGVPVGFEVAKALHLPLDVFLVRKLGVPGREELAMGALATGNVRILNSDIVEQLGISLATIEAVAREEGAELERRQHEYRDERVALDPRGKTVIL